MKTGFSLWEKLHRENPVFITGMGLQCRALIWNFKLSLKEDLPLLYKVSSMGKWDFIPAPCNMLVEYKGPVSVFKYAHSCWGKYSWVKNSHLVVKISPIFGLSFFSTWFYSTLGGWSTWKYIFVDLPHSFWSLDTPETWHRLGAQSGNIEGSNAESDLSLSCVGSLKVMNIERKKTTKFLLLIKRME